MVQQNCKFKFENITKAKKGKYDPDELSDIKRRAKFLHDRLQAGAKRYAKFGDQKRAEQAKVQAIVDNVFQQEVSDIINLDENKINGLERFFANRLGLKQKALGLSTDFEMTTAGRLRENIRDFAQVGSGIVEDIVKMRGLKQLKTHSDVLTRMLQDKGITDPNEIARLRLESIEIGQTPKLREVYKLGDKAKDFLQRRYENFLQELTDIGFDQTEIEQIATSAQKISAVMDEARLIGNALGLDIGEIENIGYISRVLSPDAKRFLDAARRKEVAQIGQESAGSITSNLTADVSKSRSTFHYIPEDTKVVAYQLGIPEEELSDIVARGELPRYLHENVSDEVLEKIVEDGFLSKIPMTTTEVHKWIVERYGDNLPFKGMKDIFVTDPKRIGEYYAHWLKQGVYSSSMSKNMVREGFKNGWAVSPKAFRENPSAYKNFKRVSQDEIAQRFPSYKGGDVYMDDNVVETWKSLLGMAGDPAVMNQFSQAVKKWGSFFNQSLLISTGYPLRQLYSSFLAYYSAGGNMLRFQEGYHDMFRITRGGMGYDALDDTQKVYRGLKGDEFISERELYRQWLLKRGNDYAPETPGFRTESDGGFFSVEKGNPFQLFRGINYMKHYFAAYGAGEGLKLAGNMFKTGQSEIFGKVALLASFNEAGAKWGLIKSLADTRPNQKVGQWASGLPPRVNTVDEVFKHVDDYFTPWNDVGDFVRFMNNTIKPFSVFAMWNVPAQIRQAMRRPHEFVNYYKIKSFMNQSTIDDDEDLNDGTVPGWMLWESPQFLWKDSESNQWISILTTNYDARAEAMNYLQKGEQMYERAMGRYVGTTDEQRDQIKDPNGMFGYFQDFMREGNPAIINALSIAFGHDIRKDRPIETDSTNPRNTIFGLHPYAEYVLSSYPPLGAIIRSNAGGWAGTPEFRDPKTGEVIIPGKTGVLGSRRVDYDITRYENDKQSMILRGLRILGFNVKVVDVGRNLQWNFSESKSLYSETKADLGKLKNDLTKEYVAGRTDKEFKRRLDLYNEKVVQNAMLHRDTLVLASMMAERGIKPTESFDKIEDSALKDIHLDLTNDQIKTLLSEDFDMLLTTDELEKLKNE